MGSSHAFTVSSYTLYIITVLTYGSYADMKGTVKL